MLGKLKPFEPNSIVVGDCLEVMARMPDRCVDLVVTDPPYGLKIARRSKNYGTRTELSRKATGDSWDDFAPGKQYFEAIFRVSKNQIIFGGNYFWENLYATPCYIIWDKRGNLPDVPFSPMEFAWTSFKRMPKKYLVRNHGFIRDSKDKRTGHPTQKPSELFMSIITDFAEAGDLIFDPFMGSGTTAIAADRLGHKWFGIDISEEYVVMALKRIDDDRRKRSQLSLC